MKIKTTRQEINGTNTYKCGYCDLQSLLSGIDAWAYNCGVYGWNWDAYDITNTKTGDTITICTGYRGTVGKQLKYEIVRKYDNKARKIIDNWELTYKQKQSKLRTLRNRFIEQVLNG